MHNTCHNKENAEKVDKILLEASLVNEKACKHRKHSRWSLPLAKAQFHLNALKTQLSQVRCGLKEEFMQTKYGIT
eukprot:2743315-Ditylum_brightwellii.AAC.1